MYREVGKSSSKLEIKVDKNQMKTSISNFIKSFQLDMDLSNIFIFPNNSFLVKKMKTKLKHQIPIAIFDSGFPSYSILSRSNNLHLSAEKHYIL